MSGLGRMPPDDVTLGEIWRIISDRDARQAREMSELKASSDRRFDAIDAKLTTLGYLPRDVYVAERADDRRRITNLEGSQTWFYRLLATTALGSVATAVLTALSALGAL